MAPKSVEAIYFCTFRSLEQSEYSPFWHDAYYSQFEEVGVAQMQSVFNELRQRGSDRIEFRGGEPLLREDLSELMQAARDFGFKIRLRSHGTQYAEKAPALRGHIDELWLTLSHPQPEIHDRILGFAGHQLFLETCARARADRTPTVIVYPVTRETITHLPEAIELAQQFNFPIRLEPHYLHPELRGFEKNSLLSLEYVARRSHVQLSRKLLRQVELDSKKWDRHFCKAGQAILTLGPDGKFLSPCVYSRGIDGTPGELPACATCSDWSYLEPSLSSFSGKLGGLLR